VTSAGRWTTVESIGAGEASEGSVVATKSSVVLSVCLADLDFVAFFEAGLDADFAACLACNEVM